MEGVMSRWRRRERTTKNGGAMMLMVNAYCSMHVTGVLLQLVLFVGNDLKHRVQ